MIIGHRRMYVHDDHDFFAWYIWWDNMDWNNGGSEDCLIHFLWLGEGGLKLSHFRIIFWRGPTLVALSVIERVLDSMFFGGYYSIHIILLLYTDHNYGHHVMYVCLWLMILLIMLGVMDGLD
jgi:hypothetical protein